jgi:hypothetical protein
MEKPDKNPPKPGPEPDRLKIEGDWEAAVSKAIGRKRPPGGWPKPEPKPRKPRSKPSK